jgi:hypothetical protein
MSTRTFIAATFVLLASGAHPALARESDAMTVSVVVMASCIVEADARPEADAERPAARVSCNTNAAGGASEQDANEPDAFAPLVETLDRPAGAIVRVTY